MKILLVIGVLISCLACTKTEKICQDGLIDRKTNIVYEAHWSGQIAINSNIVDTLFFSLIEPDTTIATILKGETFNYEIALNKDYLVWTNSTLSQGFIDSNVTVTIDYECTP